MVRVKNNIEIVKMYRRKMVRVKDNIEIVKMYQVGHSDGYTHNYNGPLYKTFDAAQLAGEQQHGAHSVKPKECQCIELSDGRVFIVSGPYKTADGVALEAEARKRAIEKLTPIERLILGL